MWEPPPFFLPKLLQMASLFPAFAGWGSAFVIEQWLVTLQRSGADVAYGDNDARIQEYETGRELCVECERN